MQLSIIVCRLSSPILVSALGRSWFNCQKEEAELGWWHYISVFDCSFRHASDRVIEVAFMVR